MHGWACPEAFTVGFGLMFVIAVLIWALDLKRNCRRE